MLKKSFFRLSNALAFALLSSAVYACPFCSEGLAHNASGYGGGMTIGIVITIFFLLGMIGSLVGFTVYLMIKEGKKSERRHQLAAAAQADLPTKV